MKHRPVRLFAAPLLAAFLALTLIAAASATAHELEWKGYEKALELAKAQNRYILINFYADWCRYCEKMDQETFADEAVARYLTDHFVIVKVDADKETDLARSYEVNGLPTMWFLTGAGERVAPLPGFVAPKMFLAILKYVSTEAYQTMTFQEFTEKKLHEQ